MLENNLSSNKRIAKNTLYLYARMLLQLGISLYASRVILHTLGIDDYGTYNVIGGVVVLFSFVNGALATATQRHLSYERGKTEGNVALVFSACLHIHLLIGAVIFVLAETVGLWFLNTQMIFPDGRMLAVNVTYQMAILCCVCNIIQTPYNASIITYERMSFYAYFGIIEALLKLGILFLLTLLPFDKLISYSVFHFIVVVIMLIVMIIFVQRRLTDIRLVKVLEKETYKYFFSFSGWTFFGSLAQLMESQGLNIIINIFYGVTINAAVGVANQVRGLLAQFVGGFQQALNPQLVMSQAVGSKERQFDLIFKSSKFSYFIMITLTFPLIIQLDFILKFWLDIVPPYTAQICCLVIIVQLVECLASPLYTTIFAIGNIKTYQLVVCLLRSFSLIFGIVVCKIGLEPYYIYIGPCFVALILLLYRLVFVRDAIRLSIRNYCKSVLFPVGVCTIIPVSAICVLRFYVPIELNFLIWLIEAIIIFIITCSIIWLLGLNIDERHSLVKIARNKLIHQ